jgi:hypothetical protein
VRKLVSDAKGTSDDEFDPQTGDSIVKIKPGRSERVTELVQLIDAAIREEAAHLRGARTQGRRRIRPTDDPPVSILKRLPRNMPLDWFEPAYYNRLTPAGRRRITSKTPEIALPPPPHPLLDFDAPYWEDAEFMAQFEDDILQQYHLPDDDEPGDEEEKEDADLVVEDIFNDDDDMDMAQEPANLADQRDEWVLRMS